MPVRRSREKLSRSEIIEILRVNTRLFSRDAQFADYIADLAVYLVEYHYERGDDPIEMPTPPKIPPPSNAPEPELSAWSSGKPLPPDLTEAEPPGTLSNRYKLLRNLARDAKDRHGKEGKVQCVACGFMNPAGSLRCENCGASLR